MISVVCGTSMTRWWATPWCFIIQCFITGLQDIKIGYLQPSMRQASLCCIKPQPATVKLTLKLTCHELRRIRVQSTFDPKSRSHFRGKDASHLPFSHCRVKQLDLAMRLPSVETFRGNNFHGFDCGENMSLNLLNFRKQLLKHLFVYVSIYFKQGIAL